METRDIIRDLCRKNKISITTLEENLGFSNGSLQKKGYLRSDRLLTVANYFNVTMEYLINADLAKNDQPTIINDEKEVLSEDEQNIITKYRKLPPDAQNTLTDLLNSLYNTYYLQKGELKTNSALSKAVS